MRAYPRKGFRKDTLQSLLNMILDGEGLLPTKRNGFTRYNTNVLGSDAKSIHEVKDEDGDTYLLASNGTLLSKSLAGTGAWSDVKTGLTTGLKTKIACYNSQIIVTNGTDAPFVLEGSGFGTVNNLALETPSTQGLTITASSGGSLMQIKYIYYITYITDKGEESAQSLPIRYTTGGTDLTLTLANIPLPSDTRITGVKLYRTEGGG